jgi:hypothetical protein
VVFGRQGAMLSRRVGGHGVFPRTTGRLPCNVQPDRRGLV